MVNYKDYITTEKIRKYPLRTTSFEAFRKVCAVINNEPYAYNPSNCSKEATEYYLTDEGLALLYTFTKSKSLQFMRSIMSIYFIRATEEDLRHPETFAFYRNFRGEVGVRRKKGSLQKAIIVRKIGRATKTYTFDSIAEAREQLKIWIRYYPVDQFTLYRWRPKAGREKIKLLPETKNNLEEYNRSRI